MNLSLEMKTWISCGVLGLAVVVILVVLVLPKKQRDPHEAMAVGCLTITVLVLLGLIGAVWLAFKMGWTWAVNGMFGAISLLGGLLVVAGIMELKARRNRLR